MKPTKSINVVLVAILIFGAFAVGGFVGYGVSAHRFEALDQQRLDLGRALRAVDLQNRLSTLRLLRERKMPKADVSALEISALVLLDAISLEDVPENSASRVVLANVAETLAAYRKDFPNSEFDPQKRPRVGALLSIKLRR